MLAAVVAAACVQPPQSRAHDNAVFGHFATRVAAQKLATKAASVGFQNVNVENEGCGDWKVYVGGADTLQQRTSFAAEARTAGFTITFQQRGEPLHPPHGQVYGVFGRMTTIGAANALSWKLASIGFNYSEIVRIGSRWAVVMPQVPAKNALSIAKEVATAGYHIQFQP